MHSTFSKFVTARLYVFYVISLWNVALSDRAIAEQVSLPSYHPVKKDIKRKIFVFGSVQPNREINIKASKSGVVEEILVSPGDKVKQGDIIARIRIVADLAQVSYAESEFKKANLNYENARNFQSKRAALFSKQLISQEELRQASLELKLAQTELEASKNALAILKEGTSAAKQQNNGSQNIVFSTMDGTVLDVSVKQGQFVTEVNNFSDGTTIAIVGDVDHLILRGKVAESDVAHLHEGMPLELTVTALKAAQLRAHLSYISPRGNDDDGSVKFEIRAPIVVPAGVVLHVGYSVNANIIVGEKTGVLTIHESDILFDETGTPAVEVVQQDNEALRRNIKTGLSDGFDIEVVEGLNETELVKSRDN